MDALAFLKAVDDDAVVKELSGSGQLETSKPFQTIEVGKTVGTVREKRRVAKKVEGEELTGDQTREVVKEYNRAKTTEEKALVLDTPRTMPRPATRKSPGAATVPVLASGGVSGPFLWMEYD